MEWPRRRSVTTGLEILHVVESLGHGGAEQNLLSQIRCMTQHRHHLAWLGGDETLLKKYIKMFIDGVPPQLASIRASLDASDFAGVKRQIHAMKPHLKFMGMKSAAGFAESIEQLCAEEKEPERVHREFAAVESDCHRAFEELRAQL